MAAAGSGSGTGWGLEFYDAVLNNDLSRLEELVEQHKIDLNAKFTEVRKKNHLDLSPIHLVCYKGFTGMLQYLIDSKADVHLTTATLRRTAFHFAVLRHKMACFNKLLSIGVNPDPRDTFGNSPCHYAAEDGDCEILDKLLRKDVDTNAQEITLKTPLMKATRNGKKQAVKKLLKTAGCAVNIRDKNGDTALHFAARHGSEDLVQILIENKSDLDVQNQWGRTPLMEAVCYNNKSAAVRLMGSGCDINKQESKRGDTALHVAVRKNYTELVEKLLETGKIKYIHNSLGANAVYDAVVSNKIETVRQFIRYNYNLDIPCKYENDGSRRSLLRIAITRGHYDMARLLMSIGCQLSNNAHIGQEESDVRDNESLSGLENALPEIFSVRSLKQICRKAVRKGLGFGIKDKIDLLPLPCTLRDYVLAKQLFE